MAGILVLNLGSTSFKFKLFELAATEKVLVSGSVERVGCPDGRFVFNAGGTGSSGVCACADHTAAFEFCLSLIRQSGLLKSPDELAAIGYKAVHGGALSGAHPVGEALLAVMESMSSFAPAHNPIYIRMMRQMSSLYPQLPQIACFETSFHATIPEYRTIYGVPDEWRASYGIRRYGFHGSSHSFIARRMQELAPTARRVISAHLGGSSSLCAIRDGQSIASSMGATPQSGVFQNNRVGDLDVFCLPELAKNHPDGLDGVMRDLATRGGLLGVSGVSNDLRDILAAREQGNARADLAIRAFVDGIAGYIGMFTAYLGGLDALVFTGGIGRNSTVIRELTCNALGFLNVQIDTARSRRAAEGRIDAAGSPVSVWVLETNEELMVARQVRAYLQQTGGV